jgi:hypothetical protein
MEEYHLGNEHTVERCNACFTATNDIDQFCNNCGYPLKGSKFEQNTFLSKRSEAEIDLIAFDKRIKKAVSVLFYLSGIFILGAIVSFFTKKDDPDVLAVVVPYIILGVLFLVLGEFGTKKTLACTVCGLCLYVITEILTFVSNPGDINLFDIIIKLVIIGYLVNGIRSAIDIERIKKEHNIA